MLKKRAVYATIWSAIEQLGAAGISTVFMLIFARILTPEDFGVYAAGALVVGFASKLAIFGLDTVVVQRPELNTRAHSTAFWISFVSSISLAIALMLFAEPISSLFGEPRIAAIIPYLAIGMVIGSANAMITALLRRELNMKALARRTLLGNALSGLLATPFVLNGFGSLALVIQSVGGTFITLILTIFLIGWPVKFQFDRQTYRSMLSFGVPVTGADFLTHFNRESPKFFVGLFLSIDALGLFSMAMRVMNLLISIVGTSLSKVSLPILSELNRTSPERMLEIFLRLVHMASVVIFLAFALVSSFSEEAVTLLLGENWREVAALMSFLCCAGALTTLNYINGSTIVAIGHPHARLGFSILRAAIGSVLMMLLTPIGLQWAAFAYMLRGFIVEPLQLSYLLRKLRGTVKQYFDSIRGAIAATVSLLIIAYSFKGITHRYDIADIYILPIGLTISAMAYSFVIWRIDPRLIDEIRGINKIRKST